MDPDNDHDKSKPACAEDFSDQSSFSKEPSFSHSHSHSHKTPFSQSQPLKRSSSRLKFVIKTAVDVDAPPIIQPYASLQNSLLENDDDVSSSSGEESDHDDEEAALGGFGGCVEVPGAVEERSPASNQPGSLDSPLQSATLCGQVIGGRFELMSLLGSGLFANVYLARPAAADPKNKEPTSSQRVALKMLKSTAPASIAHREAEMLALVWRDSDGAASDPERRPFPRLLGSGPRFVVLSVCAGGTLRAMLANWSPFPLTGTGRRRRAVQPPATKRRKDDGVSRSNHSATTIGGMPLRLVARYGRQLVEALIFLKRHAIVHADLKLDNVLFEDNQRTRCVLADFGSAVTVPMDPATEASPDFVPRLHRAPEIILGFGPRSYGVDVWALGCCLFELATGSAPFHGSDPRRLLRAILAVTGPCAESLLDRAVRRHLFFDRLRNFLPVSAGVAAARQRALDNLKPGQRGHKSAVARAKAAQPEPLAEGPTRSLRDDLAAPPAASSTMLLLRGPPASCPKLSTGSNDPAGENQEFWRAALADLLSKIFQCDPNQRITIDQIQNHPFFQHV